MLLLLHFLKKLRVQSIQAIKSLFFVLTGFLILLLAIADWTIYVNKGFFDVNEYALPAYSRSSLVLISMLVLFFAISVNPRRNPIILFMSNNSLALYCLHPFFVEPAKELADGNLFISLLLVLILSYLTRIIMKQYIQQELIE